MADHGNGAMHSIKLVILIAIPDRSHLAWNQDAIRIARGHHHRTVLCMHFLPQILNNRRGLRRVRMTGYT